MSPYFTKSKKVTTRWAHKFLRNNYSGRCAYCGVWLTLPQFGSNDRNAASLDHITPQSQGGRVTVNACHGCNADKHDLSLNEWRCVRAMRTRRPWFHYEVETLRAVCTILCSRFLPLVACV